MGRTPLCPTDIGWPVTDVSWPVTDIGWPVTDISWPVAFFGCPLFSRPNVGGDSFTFLFFGVRGRPGVRSRQSDHINASMNCEAYAAVQSGFLKAVLGGTASVRWGGVSCAMVRGGALQCGAAVGVAACRWRWQWGTLMLFVPQWPRFGVPSGVQPQQPEVWCPSNEDGPGSK